MSVTVGQAAYNLNPPIGRAGMVADMTSAVIITKVAESVTQVGLLCAPGTRGEVGMSPTAPSQYSTSPGQCKAFQDTDSATIVDATWLGVPIYDASRPPYTSSDEYAAGEPVPILVRGYIWVNVPDATVSANGDVYVWADADGATTYTHGQFLAGANGGVGLVLPRARYVTTSPSGGGLVILQIW